MEKEYGAQHRKRDRASGSIVIAHGRIAAARLACAGAGEKSPGSRSAAFVGHQTPKAHARPRVGPFGPPRPEPAPKARTA
ncbi:MAG: hypothetical protein GY789_12375 [Hyphomicrobiales bacterium]|nr:hypothetical protein [Hyphomicrobiales bacterium]MCP5000601.1 hypothetical protein [Hyphomicrobiales bacterium]